MIRDIQIIGKNGHVTKMFYSEENKKWACNLAECFDKVVFITISTGWVNRSDWRK
jgi:hypothetical protein